MANPAVRMHVIDGTIYRVKHISNNGQWLFFEADGIKKLDPTVMWCFSAMNKKPIEPYFWYENDENFVENHIKNN